jgi:hypothetical protein
MSFREVPHLLDQIVKTCYNTVRGSVLDEASGNRSGKIHLLWSPGGNGSTSTPDGGNFRHLPSRRRLSYCFVCHCWSRDNAHASCCSACRRSSRHCYVRCCLSQSHARPICCSTRVTGATALHPLPTTLTSWPCDRENERDRRRCLGKRIQQERKKKRKEKERKGKKGKGKKEIRKYIEIDYLFLKL